MHVSSHSALHRDGCIAEGTGKAIPAYCMLYGELLLAHCPVYSWLPDVTALLRKHPTFGKVATSPSSSRTGLLQSSRM